MSTLEKYRKEIGHLIEGDALDRPCSKLKIDEEVRVMAVECASKYRGSVRITHGLFYTDEEREERMKELLNVKLP